MQPFADRAFMHCHVEPAGDFLAQIKATPSHHLVRCRIGTLEDQSLQFRHLLLIECGRGASAVARLQATHTMIVVAMPLRWPSIGWAAGTFASYAQSRNVCRSMPFCSAAWVRGQPSRTNASVKRRRTCAPSWHLPANARSCAGEYTVRVILSAAPIRCPPANRSQGDRTRTRPYWESLVSHRPRGLVLVASAL